ncbi:hypothetical protein [Sandaracinobacteroides hominis]|uniref:hypothetical protein n=1 Tax=Sandaracinobacteroides hominis TaxID=2780086 RepID=UPI0018F554F0|nr:hypothetical protein [Sandaracinobacteroides hominis]
MRSTATLLILAAALTACGKKSDETPDASVQRGIDRSVADIRAADAAAAAPVVESRTISELTGKVKEPEPVARAAKKQVEEIEG